jgi:hypothetical protein
LSGSVGAAENDAAQREVERLGASRYVLKAGGFAPLYRRIEELLIVLGAAGSFPAAEAPRGSH